MTIINFFRYRATQPAMMMKAIDPVGIKNSNVLKDHLSSAQEGTAVIIRG